MPRAPHPPAPRASLPEDCPLSEREWNLLQDLCAGMSTAEAGAHAGITPSAARSRIASASVKLGVGTAMQAVAKMGRLGWCGWKPQEPNARRNPWRFIYVRELDRFNASGGRDLAARERMRVALVGLRSAVKRGAPA